MQCGVMVLITCFFSYICSLVIGQRNDEMTALQLLLLTFIQHALTSCSCVVCHMKCGDGMK